MARYGVSDVAMLLRESGAGDWADAIRWLKHHPADPSAGLSAGDREDLLRDLSRARENGVAFAHKPGELYRAIFHED
jgi:hypothetical protein